MFLSFLSVLFSGIAIDTVWLGLVMRSFYKQQIGYLFGPVQWVPVVIFYLIFSCGIIYFAVIPAVAARSIYKALFSGAFLGLLCYSTYNLTNNALINKWPVIVTFVDTLWGTIFGALVAGIGYSTFMYLQK